MTQPPNWGTGSPYETGVPAAPPPRQGKPWWVWVLGGCGGCALIVIIGIVVVVAMGVNWFKNVEKTYGNPQAVQTSLGADLPLYPGSKLNGAMTGGIVGGLRMAEKSGGHKEGSMLRGAAVFSTPDSAKKVLSFYDGKLKPAGWKRVKSTESDPDESSQSYQKNKEFVVVSVTAGEANQNLVVVMRGSREILEQQNTGVGDTKE